jgi:hypothetical protein
MFVDKKKEKKPKERRWMSVSETKVVLRPQWAVLSVYVAAVALCVLASRNGRASTVRDGPWAPWAVAFGVSLCVAALAVYPATHVAVAFMFYFAAVVVQTLNANIDAASFAGLLAGTGFYLGREFSQAESLKYVDWGGILAPLIGCVVVFIVSDIAMR